MTQQEKSKYIVKINTVERNLKTIELIEYGDKIDAVIDRVEGNFDVVSELKSILGRHKLQPEDIQEYVPNVGPGTSFTGTKVGVTVANVINWAIGRKKLEEGYTPVYTSEPNIG